MPADIQRGPESYPIVSLFDGERKEASCLDNRYTPLLLHYKYHTPLRKRAALAFPETLHYERHSAVRGRARTQQRRFDPIWRGIDAVFSATPARAADIQSVQGSFYGQSAPATNVGRYKGVEKGSPRAGRNPRTRQSIFVSELPLTTSRRSRPRLPRLRSPPRSWLFRTLLGANGIEVGCSICHAALPTLKREKLEYIATPADDCANRSMAPNIDDGIRILVIAFDPKFTERLITSYFVYRYSSIV